MLLGPKEYLDYIAKGFGIVRICMFGLLRPNIFFKEDADSLSCLCLKLNLRFILVGCDSKHNAAMASLLTIWKDEALRHETYGGIPCLRKAQGVRSSHSC